MIEIGSMSLVFIVCSGYIHEMMQWHGNSHLVTYVHYMCYIIGNLAYRKRYR